MFTKIFLYQIEILSYISVHVLINCDVAMYSNLGIQLMFVRKSAVSNTQYLKLEIWLVVITLNHIN